MQHTQGRSASCDNDRLRTCSVLRNSLLIVHFWLVFHFLPRVRFLLPDLATAIRFITETGRFASPGKLKARCDPFLVPQAEGASSGPRPVSSSSIRNTNLIGRTGLSMCRVVSIPAGAGTIAAAMLARH
jgi:hypothetical protein